MNQHPLRALAVLACSLACLPVFGDELRVGLQAGSSQWTIDASSVTLDAGASFGPTDTAAGVVGQYLFRDGTEDEGPFFVGFELGLVQENAFERGSVEVLGVPVDVAAETTASADFLWLAGYDFGRLSAYLAGGPTFLNAEVEVQAIGMTGRDDRRHLGWKAGPGLEIDLGNSSVLLRATYTSYQDKSYTDQGVSLRVEPRYIDARIAWVYKFRAEDLFGFLR